MRRAWKIILGILGTLVVLVLVAFGLMQTGFGKRQILALIEDQLSDPPAKLEAQALEGFVPFDMTVVGVKLSDAQGVWLEADRLSLAWSPSASSTLRRVWPLRSSVPYSSTGIRKGTRRAELA